MPLYVVVDHWFSLLYNIPLWDCIIWNFFFFTVVGCYDLCR